jgi:NAD(P)H-flavin reductase
VKNPYLPCEAIIIDKIIESPSIFTLRLEFCDSATQRAYSFEPGQFNMVYLQGVGEIPISIVSDPQYEPFYDHTIRVVGRVTKAMSHLIIGERVGIRGPFGTGWPLDYFKKKDVIVITGGIGCAPTVSVINYIVKRRDEFARLVIMQGVKHSDDFFFKERFDRWRTVKNTHVFLAADVVGESPYQWHKGFVTEMLDSISLSTDTCAILCGPEIMMKHAINRLKDKGLSESNCFLTLERSMHCGIGHCGHCQLGPKFICKDGPVFCYPDIKQWLNRPGL